jgi:hypothetical protein
MLKSVPPTEAELKAALEQFVVPPLSQPTPEEELQQEAELLEFIAVTGKRQP